MSLAQTLSGAPSNPFAVAAAISEIKRFALAETGREISTEQAQELLADMRTYLSRQVSVSALRLVK